MATRKQRKEPERQTEDVRVMTQEEVAAFKQRMWLRFAAALRASTDELTPPHRLH